MREDFLWGGAITAHQYEGGYTAGGKTPAVCDLRVTGEHSDFIEGVDGYHRYEKDFDLFKEMGFNVFRFSFDWSRLMVDENTYNEEGFKFYDRFIDALVERNIKVMPTLYHFEMPVYLHEKYNGFCSRKVVDIFVELSKKIIDRYKDKVDYWIIFNEQNGSVIPGPKITYGAVKPEGMKEETFYHTLMHNTLMAHCMINDYIHSVGGYVLGMATVIQSYPETCHPLDMLESMKLQADAYVFLDVFARGKYNSYYYANMKNTDTLPEILDGDIELLKKGITDGLSISYYMSTICHDGTLGYENGKNDMTVRKNPYLPQSDFGWTIDPVGLRITLRQIFDKYEMPIYIVENGFGYNDEVVDGIINDDNRIDYMREHIIQMKEAIKEGVDVRSYLSWGSLDILSSRGNMDKRYGFIYVNRDNNDMKDMKRIKKKSFDWFKKVIETNGEEL